MPPECEDDWDDDGAGEFVAVSPERWYGGCDWSNVLFEGPRAGYGAVSAALEALALVSPEAW